MNHVLSSVSEQVRVAIIENEVGTIGVDGGLLVTRSVETVVEVNNGCVCCSMRGDLLTGLKGIPEEGVTCVIVETSGVADPVPIAQTFLLDHEAVARFKLCSVVAVVDALNFEECLATMVEPARQLLFADVVVVNKSDLVGEEALERVKEKARSLATPGASVITCTNGSMDPDLFFHPRPHHYDDLVGLMDGPQMDGPQAKHTSALSTTSLRWPQPVKLTPPVVRERILRLLTARQTVLRLKGVLRLSTGEVIIVQAVRTALEFRQSDGPEGEKMKAIKGSALVFIGTDLEDIDEIDTILKE